IRASLMSIVRERDRVLAVEARSVDRQAGAQEEGGVRAAQIHLGVDGDARRERDLACGSRVAHGAHEARRPADGEELLRIRPGSAAARTGKPDVESAVARLARAVAPVRRVGPGRVENLIDSGRHGLNPRSGWMDTPRIGIQATSLKIYLPPFRTNVYSNL